MKTKPETRGIQIQFVGKKEVMDEKGKVKLVLADAPTERINGKKVINLPDDKSQKAGFIHEMADFLLTNYPKEFKLKKTKGHKINGSKYSLAKN